jgi:hypothetical protein
MTDRPDPSAASVRAADLIQDVDLACADWRDEQDVAFPLGDVRALVSEFRRMRSEPGASVVEALRALLALVEAEGLDASLGDEKFKVIVSARAALREADHA